jgi:hypothetical protein
MTRRRWTALALAALSAGCGSSGEQIAGVPDDEAVFALGANEDNRAAELERLLLAAKSATQPFRNVAAAVAAGYQQASPCVEDPNLGGMGYHYLNPTLLDGRLQLNKPEILVYEPWENGRLRLVALEYMVPAEAWHRIHDNPPHLMGHPFDDHRDPALRHGIPFAHYDLHVWIWRPNPEGMFTPFNPLVSCRFAD